MNRDEVIARGYKVQETKHSMKRRSPWHDYHRKGTYMLTLVVKERVPLFGNLKGNAEAEPGSLDAPHIAYSELGNTIINDEIGKINKLYPQVEVWKLCVMPDHIHMIVRVNEDLPEGKHLGMVVRGFKTGCSRAWWRLNSLPSGKAEGTVANIKPHNKATVPSASPEGFRQVLFEEGYNDKILLHEGQLDNWKSYLDDNPRRLLLKRQTPEFFTALQGMNVAGRSCQVVGNRFLLDIPDKVAVIVHRRYTDDELNRLREEWLACGERGGVLISAAISTKEKEVLREAMNRGYRIILLRENGFPKFYKPSGESFDACSEGSLLQISPWQYHMEQKTITRAQCLELNAMAESIANNKP